MDSSSSLPLGSVEVEVKANLDKLRADFARSRTESQAFAADMGKVVGQTKLSAAAQLQLATSYNTLIKTYDPLKDKMARYKADLEQIGRINSSGLFNDKELARLNAGVAAFAQANPGFAAAMRGTVGATESAATAQSNLANQLSAVERRYNPLATAQQRYRADLQVIAQAETAGIRTSTEANQLRAAATQAWMTEAQAINTNAGSMKGWAREAEHHLRTIRLVTTLIGVDLTLRLGQLIVKTVEATAAIKDQALQLGLTTGELQEYRAIASQVGMSADDMDSAFKTLGKNIDDLRLGRVGPFSKLIQKLGVDISDSAGKVRPTSAIFNDLIDKLGRVGDQAQRQGAQVIAFGEAGDKMGQLVKQGSSGIDQLREAVKQTGMVLSDEQIQKADQTAKKLDQVGQVLMVKFASTVVDNASAISTLADAFETLVSSGLSNAVKAISEFIDRMQQLHDRLAELRQMMADFGGENSIPALIGKNIYGDYFNPFPKNVRGMNTPGQSVTLDLPPATPVAKPKSGDTGNLDLSGILSPKGRKGRAAKFDQFESDMAREKEQQLQLEREATGDLLEQNRIDREIIDLKLQQQIEQIKRQLHNKELTGPEAKALTAQARITASMEKEAADRKLRIAVIEQQNQYANEILQLTQDGLQIARALARTDDDRRKIDLAILDSKQQQALSELQKEIALAQEAKDETRVAQLTEEMAKLKANQLAEIGQFDVEHLTGIQKFSNDLPKTTKEFNDAIHNMAFDLFNEKLQQAAQFAGDVGDAFGKAAGALARGEKPIDVFTGLIQDLAKTFTENFIEKPISDLVTQKIGGPLAKQAFGGQLNKLATEAGGAALSTTQMNTAMALATQSLAMLQAAASAAASSLSATSAAGGGGGGAGDIIGSLLSAAGSGGSGAGGDFGLSSDFDFLGSTGSQGADDILGIGFDTGGFTGSGATGEVKGVVHANEFVLNPGTVSRLGVGSLAALNAGGDPFASGGGLTGYPNGGAGPGVGGDPMGAAAAMLMQAAQALLQAATALSGGGKGGGLLSMGLGLLGGALLGGKGGGFLSGLFGKNPVSGIGAAGSVNDLLGSSGSQGVDDIFGIGFSSGGFTGDGPASAVKGVVHAGEWVWDREKTKRYWPLIQMIGLGRMPSFQGPGLGQTLGRGADGGRPLHLSFGDVHLHGVSDDRTARQTANQFIGRVQRGVAQVSRRGLNK